MSDKIFRANVEFVTPLTDTVIQFILKPDEYIDYYAGQYLQLKSLKSFYSYSIANAPLGSHRYELHIKHSRDNLNNQNLLSEMKKQGSVLLKVPFGDCFVKQLDINKPIIFIAAGSGFAQIKAMLEQLFADGDTRILKLYWGVRAHGDLYMNDKVLGWQDCMKQFSYVSVLSSLERKSLISSVIDDNSDRLLDYQIVMSGPFDLVYSMRDTLIERGVLESNLFSDAFSFL
jgi:CDP-4-dehydro-6-deoxyglucose reductase